MDQNQPKSDGKSGDVSDMLSALRMIESALDEDKKPSVSSELSFPFPLADALKLMPPQHVKEIPQNLGPADTITVSMENLFAQLARGKVSLSVAEMAYFIPSHLLNKSAFEDQSTQVTLPLALVVRAVGTQSLKKRTAQNTRRYDVGNLDDPFSRPSAKPAGEATEAPAAEPVPVEPAAKTEERPVEPAPEPPPIPVAAAAEPQPVVEPEPPPVPMPEPEPASAAAAIVEPVPAARIEPPPAVEAVPVEEKPVEPVPEPVPAPAVVAPEPQPEPEPATPTPEPEPEPVTTAAAIVEPVPAAAEAEEVCKPPRKTAARKAMAELDLVETPGCININTAGIQELMTLPGMTEPAAGHIVAWRTEHGLFESVFDLGRIPRFSKKLFRQITGMPYSVKGEHRRAKLATLLGIPVDRVSQLSEAAAAVAKRGGFAGCVLSDKDGLLLAESGAGQEAEALSAIAPKTVRQIMENMQLMTLDHLDSVTMGVKGTLYTMVATVHVVVTAIHEESRVTRTQLVFVRKAARELSWLMSPRAHAGRVQ